MRSKKTIKSKKTAARRKSSKKNKLLAKKKKAPNTKSRSSANRRESRRYTVQNLWIKEFAGDYQFVVPAENLSEGGIFLRGRLKTTVGVSQLTIPLGENGTLKVSARPVHDRISRDSYGTGYKFDELSGAQAKALKGFLRDLD